MLILRPTEGKTGTGASSDAHRLSRGYGGASSRIAIRKKATLLNRVKLCSRFDHAIVPRVSETNGARAKHQSFNAGFARLHSATGKKRAARSGWNMKSIFVLNRSVATGNSATSKSQILCRSNCRRCRNSLEFAAPRLRQRSQSFAEIVLERAG
jgi:hypothetical protein